MDDHDGLELAMNGSGRESRMPGRNVERAIQGAVIEVGEWAESRKEQVSCKEGTRVRDEAKEVVVAPGSARKHSDASIKNEMRQACLSRIVPLFGHSVFSHNCYTAASQRLA